MSYFCIHQRSYNYGFFYEQPQEIECDLDCEGGCGEDCPYYYSQEDYDNDLSDFQYEIQRESLAFY